MAIVFNLADAKYKIKDGFKVNKRFAQPAGEIMAQLEQKGELTGQALVDASRDVDAPIHDYFEWDDSVAAESFRVEQARYLIRSICVEIEPADSEPPEKVKVFYNVEQSDSNYHSIETIVQSEDLSAKLYKTAVRELKAFQVRYAVIADHLQNVFDEIDALVSLE